MSIALPACCPERRDESCFGNPYLRLQSRPLGGHDLVTVRVVPPAGKEDTRPLHGEWIELWGLRRLSGQARLLARNARCPGYSQASFDFRVRRPEDYAWFYAKAYCVWPRPGRLT